MAYVNINFMPRQRFFSKVLSSHDRYQAILPEVWGLDTVEVHP